MALYIGAETCTYIHKDFGHAYPSTILSHQ